MRSIPASLANKVRLLQQTAGNDADPKMSVIVSRQKIPIVDYGMFQTSEVGYAGVTRTAVAARRPSLDGHPDRIYIGSILAGNAEVDYGAFNGYRPPTIWDHAITINDAVDVALAFEGRYVKRVRRVEFYTIGDPWVFWIDFTGKVYGKLVTDPGAGVELGDDAVAISAIMGPGNVGALTVSDGIVLAWATTEGAVLTRQYFGGIWESANLQDTFPAADDVALIRTWDYRLCAMLHGVDGKIWVVYGNSQISGNSNIESVSVNTVTMTTDVYKTIDHDMQSGDEAITIDVGILPDVYSAIAPNLLSAANIDDGAGNWGLKVRAVFDREVFNIAGNAAAFKVVSGVAEFIGESIIYDPADPTHKTVIITLTDFNNAAPSCSLVYTPGTLDSGVNVTLANGGSVAFVATGLVPTAPPAVLSIVAVDNTTIDILFDSIISSSNIGANSGAFAITGNEPLYSPGGSNVPTTYGVGSVAFKPGSSDTVRITLTTAGRLKHPQGNVSVSYAASSGNLRNAAGSLAIPSFNIPFDPAEANLALFFNPNDPENVTVSVDITLCDVNQVVYSDAKNGDEQVNISGVTMTVVVYDTLNNPI